MQVSLSEMQRVCPRCKIFASRAATPECRPAEFHRFGPRTLNSTRERDFRREWADAPRENAILGENARTLHARTRFPARMRGRSTRERDFRRECEDAPRESAIFSENARTLHARTRFPTRIFASRAANPARRTAVFTGRVTILLFYYFSNSTVTALANKNARMIHARTRFQARMRGRSTRERDFRRECDAPRKSAILGENAKTLHARTRFPARMRGRSTRERDFRRECEDAPRENAISGENARTLHARARF